MTVIFRGRGETLGLSGILSSLRSDLMAMQKKKDAASGATSFVDNCSFPLIRWDLAAASNQGDATDAEQNHRGRFGDGRHDIVELGSNHKAIDSHGLVFARVRLSQGE